jgi:hypothetical protein
MSVAALDRQPRRVLHGARRSRHAFDGGADSHVGRASLFEVEAHGARTLDELVTDAWESLSVRGVAPCLTCHGSMRACIDVSGQVEGGECLDCGARLR